MKWVGVAAAGVLLASGISFAQPAGETTTTSDQQPADQSALAVDASKLTNDQKKARAEAMLTEMRDALRVATEILAQANAAKDIFQLNCINEKLTQIKGLLRISEQASIKMYEAMAQGADDVVNHEFTKTTVAYQKVQVLRAEAEQCVGETSIYSGDTEIQVEVDPDIARGDPTETPPPPIAPETPPVGSPS